MILSILLRDGGIVSAFVRLLLLSGGMVCAHIIETRMGYLEGLKKETRYGKFFNVYYGVPYAKPPVGTLRFEPPVEAEPWTGIFNATGKPPLCPQLTIDGTTSRGQEDCLALNVFTPSDAEPGDNLPVIFFVYGSTFVKATATDFGPDFIMSREIIFVSANYRLGALGFLSTGDEAIAGNMGLKDQTMAMKWTKENIYDFGGDPHRITIHGHSAGSVCVHAHTMSPLSKDYFHQAIMQSGFTSPNYMWDRDYSSAFARDFAELVHCPADSTRLLKVCLQSRTLPELVLAAEKIYTWEKHEPVRFRPVIEDDRVTNAFLNKSHYFGPYASSSKPWLLGITTGEGAHDVGNYFHPDSSIINIDSKLLFPVIGAYQWSSNPNHVNFITQFLKTRFFGEEAVRNTTDNADLALVKVLTGIKYERVILDVIQRYGGTKYVYLMDYRYAGGYTISKGGQDGRYLGVSHADELPMMFKMTVSEGVADEDYAFGEELITRWVNFAYSGNPNVPFAINTSVLGTWTAVSTPRIEFLWIKRHGGMEEDYFLKEYSLWRKIPIFSKYFSE